MKEIISEKIDNMEELEDRTILKGIVRDVFEGLANYQKEFNHNLEDRVFNQIEDKEKHYDIYTTLVSREELKAISDFLLPILEEDSVEESPEEILEKIQSEDQPKIEKLFFTVPIKKIDDLRQENKVFEGQIKTEEGSYRFEFVLEYNKEYIKAEKELYNIFVENMVGWRTANNPYGRRIFDVVVMDYDPEIEEITEFEEIEYDLDDVGEEMHRNQVPVWNIREITQKGEGFPVPAGSKINYDHYISVENLDLSNGYLVLPEGFNIVSVKKEEDDIVITSDKSDSTPWQLLEIIQNKREKERDFDFPLLSNGRKEVFINKLMRSKMNNIQTRGDLERIINSYRNISEIKLEEVVVSSNDLAGITRDYNSFIKDEIREANLKKTMLLKCSTSLNGYLKEELLSFLVSEVQLYFPNYKCKGVYLG